MNKERNARLQQIEDLQAENDRLKAMVAEFEAWLEADLSADNDWATQDAWEIDFDKGWDSAIKEAISMLNQLKAKHLSNESEAE